MTITYADVDTDLLERAGNGDEAAFTTLYRRHHAAVRRLAYTYRLEGDPDELEDATFAEVVEGRAPPALEGLPDPDAIFVGGGVTSEGVLDRCLAALRPGGRLVATAVTLEAEGVLAAAHAAHGGRLVRLAVAHAEPLGGFTGWRAQMPVTQWSFVREGA